MLVKDYYLDCLQYEEATLAHYIHHLLAESKLSLTDDVSKIDLNLADHEKVAELIQKNVLGVHRVNIYSLKINPQQFFFIFAQSPEEAIQFFADNFGQKPLNCVEYPLEFEILRGNEVVTFREMRREFSSFPALVGEYTRIKK
ncbi:hypothetical protein [Bacillus suaedaesalsae]|uniref:Uncharacterized protein n=1 Tax=Bacillus suaedaesalsae TaxID=2810349 RepID=A0ABS2DET9_9BACI|nr:hypothetical protein [Bacillus suaedaesalsae]MBM6616975.1 hypothetical protein [Bacillus suaedaesalsae]